MNVTRNFLLLLTISCPLIGSFPSWSGVVPAARCPSRSLCTSDIGASCADALNQMDMVLRDTTPLGESLRPPRPAGNSELPVFMHTNGAGQLACRSATAVPCFAGELPSSLEAGIHCAPGSGPPGSHRPHERLIEYLVLRSGELPVIAHARAVYLPGRFTAGFFIC